MSIPAHWNAASLQTTCHVQFAPSALQVDADPATGSAAEHPTPHDLLDAALAACTTLTLQMYIARKGFDVRDIRVEVSHAKGDAGYVMTRVVHLQGALSDEQRASVLRIADACPIHKVLVGEIAVVTEAQVSPL